MLDKIVTALNTVQRQVWQVLQFVALLAVVAYGGHLLTAGHQDAGMALISGSFALMKFEADGDK